jgi:hypothetical protein
MRLEPEPADYDDCFFLLLQALVDFLRQWHPSCLNAAGFHRDVEYHRRYLDVQEGVFYKRPGARERIKRRPSMHRLETKSAAVPQAKPPNKHGMSEVARLFPRALDLLPLPQEHVCTVKHYLFGYPTYDDSI